MNTAVQLYTAGPRSGTRRAAPALPAVAVALALALASAACAPDAGPVVFGVAGPFSTSYGASMRQGVELAAREVNAAGGIDGRPLELRFLDDEADPDAAIQVAQTLFDDPEVVAVVGHVNSGATMHAGTVYQQGLPAVATSATSVEISRLGEWVFRVAPSDSANAEALAQVAYGRGGSAAVLYENEDYGRGLADRFHAALVAAGGRVVSVDPYLPTTPDFRPFLERMRGQGVELVLIAGLETDAARIIDQAREIGLGARFLGGDGLEGLVTMGDAYDGTLVGVLYHPQASAASAAFASQFRAVYGREADSFAALGYDATRLLALAAREAAPERAAIREYLAEVGRGGNPAYAGVTGPIRFDDNGDPVDKSFDIGVLSGGTVALQEVR